MIHFSVKPVKTALVLMTACSMLMALAWPAWAKDQKTRLNVGFPTEEALENLQVGSDWQYNEMGSVFWPLIYDQLWVLGPDYKPIPRLAVKWKTTDNQTWRFFLNKNAKFHDGTPVTAQDVAFTLWYLPKADPSWEYPDTKIDKQSQIKVIDDYTVEFTLSQKWAGKYPPMFWTPILPKHIWEAHKDQMIGFKNEEAIGSGPFKLKEFKSGEFIWMVKNEDYYGEKPNVDEVVFKSFGGQDALGLALKRGEVDIIGYNGVSPLSVNGFKRAKNVKVQVSPGIDLVWLTFNLHKKTAIADKRVRQAIMYGIDRKKIIDMAYLGYAQDSHSFIYPELPEYNNNLPMYAYDVGHARELLDAAGCTDTDNDGIRNDPKTGKNVSLDFMVPPDWPDEVKTARIIKEQMEQIGLQINLKVLDLDTFNEFIYTPTDDKFDIAVFEEGPGPNGNWIWEYARSFDNGGEGWNQAWYNNPEFDKALDDFLMETDLEKRKEKAHKIQAIMAEDLPYANLVRPDLIGPYRTDRLEGFVETMGGFSTWINPWTYFKVRPKQ
jgi:peptide/nickel transport system substrate-binding protein